MMRQVSRGYHEVDSCDNASDSRSDLESEDGHWTWENFNYEIFQALQVEHSHGPSDRERSHGSSDQVSLQALNAVLENDDLKNLHVKDLKEFDVDHDDAISFDEFVDFLREVWAGRAVAFTRAASTLQRNIDWSAQHGSFQVVSVKFSDASVSEFEKLKERWLEIDFAFLYRSFVSLQNFGSKGTDQREFLDCLVAKVPFMDDQDELICRDLWLRRRMAHLDDINLLRSSGCLSRIRDEIGPRQFRNALQENWFHWLHSKVSSTNKKEYHFAITSANFMDFSAEQLSNLILAFTEAGVASGVYKTLFATAVLTCAWSRVQAAFFRGMVANVVFISLLLWLAGDARSQQDPPLLIVIALFVCAAAEAFAQLREIRAVIQNKPPHISCRSAAYGHITRNAWTCHECVVTFYALGVVIFGAVYHRRKLTHVDLFEQNHDIWLHHHPLWVAALIAFKVNQFNVKLLAVKAFGRQVLPAYEAIFDKASLMFVLFMAMNFLTSILSYYAIPVQFHKRQAGEPFFEAYTENIFETMLRIFKLDFGGEAALDELEGNRKKLVLDLSNEKNAHPSLEDHGRPNPYWHHGVSVMYVVWFMWITLGLLNVLIGLLSNLYDEKLKKQRELFEHFRANYIIKLLLRSQGKSCFKDERRQQEGQFVWLAYDPETFEEDTESECDAARISQLVKQVEELTNLRRKDTLKGFQQINNLA
eukprot:TRINITY_DN41261_c0_g1_i1.p1 TRINITY_DN41261_c0_g1~~TRINITY_DN41261_c0_g1_i1.p1  ORF type:complete len:703 (-),score=134.63 TRINITY_DN41261_c0_g1_i1:31-2139(-)